MAYTIEVYYQRQRAERNILTYSLYVLFFPQMVAGPIERPQNLIHQFNRKPDFNRSRISSGLRLILWGYFKKTVVADHFSPAVDAVFLKPHSSSGAMLTLATLMFAVQIYGDFSGYSDMAIGSARVLGFKLMPNFNRPYSGRSVTEFWHRWHISLSTWFRDYVFIPLGFGHISKARTYFFILFTFVVSGLWHGASWTFIIWGALNGFYIVASHIIPTSELITGTKWRRLFFQPFQIAMTFILISFSWIFFRATNTADAFHIVSKLGTGWNHWAQLFKEMGFWLTFQYGMYPIIDWSAWRWKLVTSLAVFFVSG